MPLINEMIGNFGKYHLFLCIIIFSSKFGIAFHQMAIIFLAPPAQYKCPMVNGVNTTCCDHPIFDKTVFSRTIVTEWNLICNNSWLKDFNQTIFQLGVLIGSLLFGIFSDNYGRKPVLLVATIIEIFSGIIASFLPDYWSFTVMRLIIGIAVGGVNVIGFVIVMEFVGAMYRDTVAALYHLPFTFGHILLAPIGYYIRDYAYFQFVISLSTVILFIYICALPESPRWLLAKNKTFKASALMERVAKINKLPTENFQEKIELHQLQHFDARRKSSFLDLFRTKNIRNNMIIMSFAWFVCSYCFYGMSYYVSHLTGDVFINVLACGSVCLAGCFLAIPIMKFMNRRHVMMIGNATGGICLLIIALVPEGIASVVFSCIGVLFIYMIFIFAYLYCSEMFPTVVRNGALGVASMMARLGSMIAPFIAALRPYGQWCAPVAFGVFPIIAAGLCFLLPETKNCELPMTIQEGEALGPESRRTSRASASN